MIILDTHAWIWWASESPNLSDDALKEISEADDVGVSIISCGEFHGDPADRIIVATCLNYGASLVSKDQKIAKWGHIPVIW